MAEEQPADDASNAATNEGIQARRKRLIIIGAAIAAIVIVVVAILLLVLLLGRSSCKTVDIEPETGQHISRPIPSQNNRALVRFSGHLKFRFDNEGDFDEMRYLQLNLLRVHHSLDADDNIHIRLDTDCATVDIVMSKNSDKKRYTGKMIYIRPSSSSVRMDLCRALPTGLYFYFEQYYRCHQSLFYPCIDFSGAKAGGKRLNGAGIQIDLLDLELDGDSVSIESGIFDKNPADC